MLIRVIDTKGIELNAVDLGGAKFHCNLWLLTRHCLVRFRQDLNLSVNALSPSLIYYKDYILDIRIVKTPLVKFNIFNIFRSRILLIKYIVQIYI